MRWEWQGQAAHWFCKKVDNKVIFHLGWRFAEEDLDCSLNPGTWKSFGLGAALKTVNVTSTLHYATLSWHFSLSVQDFSRDVWFDWGRAQRSNQDQIFHPFAVKGFKMTSEFKHEALTADEIFRKKDIDKRFLSTSLSNILASSFVFGFSCVPSLFLIWRPLLLPV